MWCFSQRFACTYSVLSHKSVIWQSQWKLLWLSILAGLQTTHSMWFTSDNSHMPLPQYNVYCLNHCCWSTSDSTRQLSKSSFSYIYCNICVEKKTYYMFCCRKKCNYTPLTQQIVLQHNKQEESCQNSIYTGIFWQLNCNAKTEKKLPCMTWPFLHYGHHNLDLICHFSARQTKLYLTFLLLKFHVVAHQPF